ncbi:N-acyl-D-amino-acid deacylase family protein [Brevibacterium marinum]|uniref:N-acyl-D-amino-acid deacylase n=1 Tax=Brevibacterium marinum TaxID=418643 RepID=A0A846S136_9MICO|nr:amidohydrolase family protein [Brevibacterium marinum]NJC56683.1 N-acyl-D-amino-acid deacylase [Brevibacterium marinum]
MIDAHDQVLVPGFIDLHSHADFSIMADPAAQTQLLQGVTTALVGNCGSSPFPARSVAQIQRDNAHLDAEFTADWTGARGFFEAVHDVGPGINIALQVGLSSIRSYVMGPNDAAPDSQQLDSMKRQVAEAAEVGVYGFSSGLIYAPGMYSQPNEVAALVAEAAEYGLLYSTHMRNESDRLLPAVEEAINAATAAGARLEISHLKAMGPENYGSPALALARIEEAREGGLDVKADVYPYTASSTRLTSRLPGYAMDGGQETLLERLSDPLQRSKIAGDMAARFDKDIDPEGVVIAALGAGDTDDDYTWAIGESIAQIGRREGCYAEEAAMRVLSAHGASVGIVNHAMDRDDVAKVLSHPLVSVASDGWTLRPKGEGMPHPRSFGTFVRVLGKYVREEGLITLEEAVRKMTSQPAERLQMENRGIISQGKIADLAIFDADSVRENSTFDDPWQLASGLSTVLVGGNIAVKDGQVTAQRYGNVLRKR